MLKTSELCVKYGDTVALNALNLNVNSGEIYCLLGANGAGKTTLINSFLGFVAPASGSVKVNDLEVSTHSLETKRSLAYIPEQVMLYGVLTGVENLEYFAALATGERLSKDKLVALLERAGLDASAATRPVSTYSKGMRQKVGIAIALAKNAKVLLLDEPTSGLDPGAANEFSLLLQSSAEQGVAVLTTTHDLFHAKQTGTRVGIMRKGDLVAEFNSESVSHSELEAVYLEHMRSAP